MRLLISILLLLVFVPMWTGTPRLPLPRTDQRVVARGWAPRGGWPARIGALEPVGAIALSSADPAFGGFSALSLANGRATMLSDGGYTLSFGIAGRWLSDARFVALRDGPREGWSRDDRDTESLSHDPVTGRWWVGYESANAIWRYAPDFRRAEAQAAPAAMREWNANGGPETLLRLADGRFLVISETVPRGRSIRPALVFAGDPTRAATRVTRLAYRPPAGFSPTDAAQLPDGDVLILNRRFRPPLRFAARIVRVPLSALSVRKVIGGPVIADFPDSLIGENMEGIAVTREAGATMVWIVTDNDMTWWRPTILAKYRLR